MKNIIFIIGLPGSGKTTLGKKLLLEKANAIFVDDPSVVLKSKNLSRLFLKAPEYVDTLIISDPHFVMHTQNELMSNMNNVYPDSSISFIYFENNPEQCFLNIQERNKTDFRKISQGFLQFLSKEYDKNHPKETEYIPVFKLGKPKLKKKLKVVP
jgi:adenylate kinase family enzyme